MRLFHVLGSFEKNEKPRGNKRDHEVASCSPYKDLMRLGMLPHLINRGLQQRLQVTRIKMILQKARHARRDLTSPKFFRTRADDDEHIRSVEGKLKSEVNIEIKR